MQSSLQLGKKHHLKASMSFEMLFFFSIIGLITGILSGLFGAGGGIIIVPTLCIVLKKFDFSSESIMHVSIGTSLAIMIFTSIASGGFHGLKKNVSWPIFFKLCIGIVLGVGVGALFAKHTGSSTLQHIFSIVVFINALYILFKPAPTQSEHSPPTPILILFGLFIGILSALLGIGGSMFTVPFLLWFAIPIKKSIGTSALCGIPVAVCGTLFYILLGIDQPAAGPNTLGYIYWPTILPIGIFTVIASPIGVKLALKFPHKILQRAFAFLLIVIGINMLVIV